MDESLLITIFPVVFAVIFLEAKASFRRRQIDLDGVAPIPPTIFYLSKYAIVVVWAAMVADGWGAPLSMVPAPAAVRWAGIALWALGFVLLLLGRMALGGSLRVGSPKESTTLKTDGLLGMSRNPMYVGVYTTLLAAVLYTLNPILLALAIFIVVVHHRIVLAEERFLQGAFGEAYQEYCRRVRRYL